MSHAHTGRQVTHTSDPRPNVLATGGATHDALSPKGRESRGVNIKTQTPLTSILQCSTISFTMWRAYRLQYCNNSNHNNVTFLVLGIFKNVSGVSAAAGPVSSASCRNWFRYYHCMAASWPLNTRLHGKLCFPWRWWEGKKLWLCQQCCLQCTKG